MAVSSMIAGFLQKIGDILTGFFAIIPQAIYFLYASMASIMDFFQLLFRKLVGLDTYYIQSVGEDSKIVTKQYAGDIITDMIEGVLGINKNYSAFNTVFWSMIIFGLIVLIIMTIITLIKAHYNYDAKKSSPAYILKSVFKAISAMVIIPITTIFGLYIGFAVFGALDTITTPSSGSALTSVFEPEAIQQLQSSTEPNAKIGSSEVLLYGSYDMFGEKEWANTETFSGIMFKACSPHSNRVRIGSYTVETAVRPETDDTDDTDEEGSGEDTPDEEMDTSQRGWESFGIFFTTSETNKTEIVASQIDFAFANNLTLTTEKTATIGGEAAVAVGTSLMYGPSLVFASGLNNVKSFSKFNVGLVWYYYNLWSFNFLVGFGGMFIAFTLFTNVLFGLMLRIIFSVALFLVYPPMVGIIPFDEGKAVKSWREQFMTQIISGYASVIAMNIVFLLMPIINNIKLFNVAVVDAIINMIIMLAALSMVKRFSDIVTKLVGVKDIGEVGAGIKKEGAPAVMKGIAATVGSASVANTLRKSVVGTNSFIPSLAGGGRKYRKYLKDEINATRAAKKKQWVEDAKAGNKKGGARWFNKEGEFRPTAWINKMLDTTGGTIAMGFLGLNIDPHRGEYQDIHTGEYDDEGNEIIMKDSRVVGEDALGNPIYEKRKKPLKRIKEGLLDMSKVGLKALGSITGAKNFIDKLDKNTSAVDIFKSGLNDLAYSLGTLRNPEMSADEKQALKRKFKTQKVKDDEAEEAQVNATLPTYTMDTRLSKQILRDIEQMVKILDDKK